ncbi:MAG: SBBP repeat-containing protein, partial [Candidatus Omnitrophica bacterium]|nr:SBBP repeat-containing protein [Candidatus Omnitrophota bacterium]
MIRKNNAVASLVLITATILISFPTPTFAEQLPEYAWANVIGATGHDQGTDVAVDSNGNVFITGLFQGLLDFDPTEGQDVHESNAPWLSAIFVTKFNADGSYSWTRTFADVDSESGATGGGRGIAVDSNGDVIITGHFQGIVDFDPSPNSQDIRMSDGYKNDGFVTKLHANGSYGWTRSFLGAGNGWGKGVAVDQSGNIFVTGFFETPNVDFDSPFWGGSGDVRASNGGADIFVTSIGSDGTYRWTRTIGGAMLDDSSDIAVGSAGSILITGLFNSPTIDLDPTEGEDLHVINAVGGANCQFPDCGTDVFVVNLTAEGIYSWGHSFGGIKEDWGQAIGVDSSGNVIVTGTFRSPLVDFDPSLSGEDIHTVNQLDDIFVSKFASDGSYLWTRSFGGINYDNAGEVAIDAEDNLRIIGVFKSAVDFDPSLEGEDIHTALGSFDSDGFITRLYADGSYGWTVTIGGNGIGNIWTTGIALDSGGDIVVSGYFRGSCDFDPSDEEHILGANGQEDIYVFKLSSRIVPLAPMNLQLTVEPSSAINLTWEDSSDNEDGFILYRQKVDLSETITISLSADETSHIDNTVEPGASYTYWIVAFNGIGSSEPSNTVSVTINQAPVWLGIDTNFDGLPDSGDVQLHSDKTARFKVLVSDPDNDQLTVSMRLVRPLGRLSDATFDGQVFRWTADAEDMSGPRASGEFDVQFTADDGRPGGIVTSPPVHIDVPFNCPPRFSNSPQALPPLTMQVYVGDTVDFSLYGDDGCLVDGAQYQGISFHPTPLITYDAGGNPTGIVLNPLPQGSAFESVPYQCGQNPLVCVLPFGRFTWTPTEPVESLPLRFYISDRGAMVYDAAGNLIDDPVINPAARLTAGYRVSVTVLPPPDTQAPSATIT